MENVIDTETMEEKASCWWECLESEKNVEMLVNILRLPVVRAWTLGATLVPHVIVGTYVKVTLGFLKMKFRTYMKTGSNSKGC